MSPGGPHDLVLSKLSARLSSATHQLGWSSALIPRLILPAGLPRGAAQSGAWPLVLTAVAPLIPSTGPLIKPPEFVLAGWDSHPVSTKISISSNTLASLA